jgi:hypothetical protein
LGNLPSTQGSGEWVVFFVPFAHHPQKIEGTESPPDVRLMFIAKMRWKGAYFAFL